MAESEREQDGMPTKIRARYATPRLIDQCHARDFDVRSREHARPGRHTAAIRRIRTRHARAEHPERYYRDNREAASEKPPSPVTAQPTPQNVFESLEADPAMWTFVGRFAHSEAAAPTEAQKAVYQAALQQNKQAGEEVRKDWTRRVR
jgi:hypothetical protein